MQSPLSGPRRCPEDPSYINMILSQILYETIRHRFHRTQNIPLAGHITTILQRFCCMQLFLTVTTRSGKLLCILCIFETRITSTIYFIPVHCRLNNTHPTVCSRIFFFISFFISKAPPSSLRSQASETHIASLLLEATQSRSGPSVTRISDTCNLHDHCDHLLVCSLLPKLVHIVEPCRLQAKYHAFKLREDAYYEAEWDPGESFEM